MTVTICVGEDEQALPSDDAAVLAEQLRLYAEGYRGEVTDPAAALALADAIEQRLVRGSEGVLRVGDRPALDALHRVLNSIVHDVGPAMQLYTAVDAARRAA
jgi:hypothetical protein